MTIFGHACLVRKLNVIMMFGGLLFKVEQYLFVCYFYLVLSDLYKEDVFMGICLVWEFVILHGCIK